MPTDELEFLRDHPVFICGHPKAGTSLVRSILDSHPQLIVYPEETVFFRRYLPGIEGLSCQEQLTLADQMLIHIFTWNKTNPPLSQEGYPDRDFSEISYEAVRHELHSFVEQTCRNPGDILSAAILAFGSASGQITDQSRWWVEKSPYNEYYAEQIFDWWPHARCIHVIRDPRDNYVSYRRKHPDWRPEFFAANWKQSTQTGTDNQKRYGVDQYMILRYEDLVQYPENILKSIAEFLSIKWDKSLETPTRAGKQWVGNSMFAIEFSGISSAPTHRWKDTLAPKEAYVIEIMTEAYLKQWRYEIGATDRKLIDSSTALLRVLTWPIRRRVIRRLGT